MLLVDPRAGSKELVAPLRKMGLDVDDSTEIPADIAFTGKGEGGRPVTIGVEFKKLGENVASLRSGRLCGHQLPTMREHFDYCWLLVEGELLYDKQGRLQRRAGKRTIKPLPGSMGVSEYLKRLLVLHLRGGLNPWHTQNRSDTLKFLEVLYRTWTDVALDDHKSHLAIYQAPSLVPMSKTQKALYAWDHLGLKGSKAVERHFKSVKRAANATAEEFAAIELVDEKTGKVRRLGAKDAAQIVAFLNGR